MPRTSEMTASSAQICRDLGWEVGTLLRTCDQFDRVEIRITAIGNEEVLAEQVRDGAGIEIEEPCELLWELTCRDWERA